MKFIDYLAFADLPNKPIEYPKNDELSCAVLDGLIENRMRLASPSMLKSEHGWKIDIVNNTAYFSNIFFPFIYLTI